jgi:hypothetical protein
MIIRLLIILVAMPFISAAQVVSIENYSNNMRSLIKKNNVRFIIGWTYQYSGKQLNRYGAKSSFQKFDKEGYVIEEVSYKQSGESNFECTRQYNSEGFEVSTIGVKNHYFFSKKWQYKKVSSLVVEKAPYKAYNSSEKYVMTFDRDGNKVQEQGYDESGTLVYNHFFKYDSRNNLVEKLEFDGSNSLFEKWVYNFDDKQNIIQTLRYDNEGKIFLKYIYTYDDKGNPIEELLYNGSEQPIQKTKYLYQTFTW